MTFTLGMQTLVLFGTDGSLWCTLVASEIIIGGGGGGVCASYVRLMNFQFDLEPSDVDNVYDTLSSYHGPLSQVM